MLLLFETAAGYAVFKVKNEKKLEEVKNLAKEFENTEFMNQSYVSVVFVNANLMISRTRVSAAL